MTIMKAAIISSPNISTEFNKPEADATCAVISSKMANLSTSSGTTDVSKNLPPAAATTISSSATNVSTAQPPFPTVVFSRKTTYHGPYDDESDDQVVPASLAHVVHQTDRNGNHIVSATYAGTKGAAPLRQQQSQFPTNEAKGINSPQPKGIQRFFTNVYSALGLAENGIPPNSQITTSAVPPPASTSKATSVPQQSATNSETSNTKKK